MDSTAPRWTTLIRGGLVFDGTGAPAREADVVIEGERVTRIAARGALGPVADAREIDATGRWVVPGFVDTHTHYDAEVALAPALTESVRHGVTTVVIGSCSISFVAAAPEEEAPLSSPARAVRAALASRGAMFFVDLVRLTGLLRTHVEQALAELVAWGLVTSDSFTGLRALITPASRRASFSRPVRGSAVSVDSAGRWALVERTEAAR